MTSCKNDLKNDFAIWKLLKIDMYQFKNEKCPQKLVK